MDAFFTCAACAMQLQKDAHGRFMGLIVNVPDRGQLAFCPPCGQVIIRTRNRTHSDARRKKAGL